MKKIIFITLTLLYTGTSYGGCISSQISDCGIKSMIITPNDSTNKKIKSLEKRISKLEKDDDYSYRSTDGLFLFKDQKSRREYDYGNYKTCGFIGGDQLVCYK